MMLKRIDQKTRKRAERRKMRQKRQVIQRMTLESMMRKTPNRLANALRH